MKKMIITLLCSAILTQGFSQNSAVDEESIKKMLVQETKEAYAAKDVSGYFVQSPQTFAIYNNRSGYDSKMGSDAISEAQKELFGSRPRDVTPDNENYTFKFYGKEACLVTFDQYLYGKNQKPSKEVRMVEKSNGQWKIAAVVALYDYSSNDFEQAGVRKTIQDETKAYHAGNVELMEKQWAEVDYIERQAEYFKTVAGASYLKGPRLRAFSVEFKKAAKPTGQTVKISEYQARISGMMAWVTYNQETVNADGSIFNKTRELRILERTNGWKIVMMGFTEL